MSGRDEEKLSDLARAIAGALSLGRLGAVREDDRLLADLLDESRVIPGQGGFQLEVALPLASVERQLGECAKSARERVSRGSGLRLAVAFEADYSLPRPSVGAIGCIRLAQCWIAPVIPNV